MINKQNIVDHIYNSLKRNQDIAATQFFISQEKIAHFYIDDVLPEDLAKLCHEVFPNQSDMKCLKSFREYKYVSAQMDKHDSLLETVLYAFQDPKIIKIISDICNLNDLEPDASLYAGGLSLMTKDNFLNPHLDNSHDANRKQWRVLNLLYYVSPNWKTENGGHLELWPDWPKENPIQIESKFNRLVVMATHQDSWHSVNKVTVDQDRCCISNYYFSQKPLKAEDKFHVTNYRGRPNETLKNIILTLDGKARMLVRKVFKKGIRKNPHTYVKKKED